MKSLGIKLFFGLSFMFFSFQALGQTSKYKLMLQMTNYDGEPAYLVVSLINPKGGYEKTLAVMGDDKRWYKTIKEWFHAQKSKPEDLTAVTGASVAGGDRNTTILSIEDAKFDKGYKIRIETAVEHLKYYAEDAAIPLTKAGFSNKITGKGYVRFVKLSKI